MKIVVESNIPYIKGVFEPMADVRYLAPEQIDADALIDADAFVTRTRTHCDKTLLGSSRCQMIASATIGLDHVDTAWCENNGIEVANAPGCNAPAVAQYVLRAIIELLGEKSLENITLGIVGVGNVGKTVEKWSRGLGINLMLCDPPRAEKEGASNFHSLNELAEKADVITFHTPLTKSGAYPTYHLADADFFNSLKRKPVIINSSRGAVVDNNALVEALDNGQVSAAVIDCWENEPEINRDLLQRTALATPHIAGYSASGKIRATQMAVEAVCRHFGLPLPVISAPKPAEIPAKVTTEQIINTYNIADDSNALKSQPSDFETLRNHYNLRKEPNE